MSSVTGPLIRLTLLALLAVGGYYAYQRFSPALLSQSPAAGNLQSRVLGITDSLGINTEGLLNQANQKLVKSQPIIKTDQPSPLQGEVNTQVRQVIDSTTRQITDQIKDLPKQEAAKITRQVCDQIISELEK